MIRAFLEAVIHTIPIALLGSVQAFSDHSREEGEWPPWARGNVADGT